MGIKGIPYHDFEEIGHQSEGGAFQCKRSVMELRRFQKEFLERALAPEIGTAALCIPRGNGKSFLAAHILTKPKPR